MKATCRRPPAGWHCTRDAGHDGPCAPLPDDVQRIADMLGGTVESTMLDGKGNGGAVVTMPLPSSHWIYGNGQTYEAPPMRFRMGTDDPRKPQVDALLSEAARYAVRASTCNGMVNDFDPDAMVRNFVTALIGYHTSDGLSDDAFANPARLARRGVIVLYDDSPPRSWWGRVKIWLAYCCDTFPRP